jgi:beta-lactamase superfamily II metal-dependent hydrolase
VPPGSLFSDEYLHLWLFGPGIGESQVLRLPGNYWMVVDSCVGGEVVLPLELLRECEVEALHLLVLTHPHADHYQGLEQIMTYFRRRPEDNQPRIRYA